MLRRSNLVLIVGLTVALEGVAGTIISNLPTADGGTDTDICNTTSVFCSVGSVSAAVGFQMPGGGAFRLDSIDLSLQNAANQPDRITLLTVRLFSDSAGHPGSPLLTFTTPTFPDTPLVFTANFLTPSPFFLQANQGYWIVLQDDDPISTPTIISWRGNFPATIPTGSASYLGFSYDFNLTPPFTLRNGPNFPQGFDVNATAVPEPSTVIYMAPAFLVATFIATFRRFRKTRRRALGIHATSTLGLRLRA